MIPTLMMISMLALILGFTGFVFGCYACIKVIAQEKAVHSITYVDAEQVVKEQNHGYDFNPNVDEINEEIKDEAFEKEMDNNLSNGVII